MILANAQRLFTQHVTSSVYKLCAHRVRASANNLNSAANSPCFAANAGGHDCATCVCQSRSPCHTQNPFKTIIARASVTLQKTACDAPQCLVCRALVNSDTKPAASAWVLLTSSFQTVSTWQPFKVENETKTYCSQIALEILLMEKGNNALLQRSRSSWVDLQQNALLTVQAVRNQSPPWHRPASCTMLKSYLLINSAKNPHEQALESTFAQHSAKGI
eukprot:5908427-Amphidinium_carterae.5